MKALGVDSDYVDYMMGHMVDTYHDIQSKGTEFLRDIYARAGFEIRPKNKSTPTEILKKMVRSIGLDPDKVLNREALSETHRTYATVQEREQEEIALLTKALLDGIKHPQDGNISRAENSQR